MPTQLSGAKFLADRRAALLADEPRCGKTGAAIIGADYIFARTILVVTTASGRSVWKRAFPTWSVFPRKLQVVTPKIKLAADTEVAIVAWGDIGKPDLRVQLLARKWDLILSDEDHWAKNFEATRTQAFYGELLDDGDLIQNRLALYAHGDRVWPLTGTSMPNSPFDMYPRLRALAPERLAANAERGWPDVQRQSDFKKRYCLVKPKKIGNGYYARWIDVVIGGRNEAELAERLEGFMLLRTQSDVGIRQPVYETFPLTVSDANRRQTEAGVDAAQVLAAAESGETKDLEIHLGPLRRLTGQIKARAVVDAIKDEFAGGLDKIVLAFWHHEVGAILKEGLSEFGVVGIDGSTTSEKRLAAELAFHNDPKTRVFLGQIIAAGEAIDLSAAGELLFVETSFVPKDMRQMSDRITNVTQTRLTRVRVATLEGSIDDALQASLMRKWSSIRKVLSK